MSRYTPKNLGVAPCPPPLSQEVSHRNLGLKRCRATRGCRRYSCGCRATVFQGKIICAPPPPLSKWVIFFWQYKNRRRPNLYFFHHSFCKFKRERSENVFGKSDFHWPLMVLAEEWHCSLYANVQSSVPTMFLHFFANRRVTNGRVPPFPKK